MPDRTESPYSRIYATLARDHPRVWFDPALLGWYVRLLLPADRAWPGLADLPRGVPDDVLETLATDQVIDLIGDHAYRFHGLDNERNGRRSRGWKGGIVRSSSAPRDAGGRFAADAGDLNRDAGSDAGTGRWSNAGTATLDDQRTSEPNRTEGLDDDLQSSSSSPTESLTRAPAREGPDPQAIDCDAYQAHRADHRWIEGIGWKCVACEATRALGEPSFREKVERAGGDAW